MIPVDGEPSAKEAKDSGDEDIGFGRCPDCGTWLRGRFREDLTPRTALAEHPGCPTALEHQSKRDPARLTVALAVSVAAFVIVCALLLTIRR